jgi:hypothetical protein
LEASVVTEVATTVAVPLGLRAHSAVPAELYFARKKLPEVALVNVVLPNETLAAKVPIAYTLPVASVAMLVPVVLADTDGCLAQSQWDVWDVKVNSEQ